MRTIEIQGGVMWFKLAFGFAFIFAMTIAARATRFSTRRHGGTLNQLHNEVRGLIAIRATLGLIFYAALAAWIFRGRSFPWMYLPLPIPIRWVAVGLLLPTLTFFAASFRAL